MKTGMELVKELRTDRTHAFNRYGENAESYRAFDAGMNHATDELEAWLREADKFAESQQIINYNLGERDEAWTQAWLLMREHLLGTTQERK